MDIEIARKIVLEYLNKINMDFEERLTELDSLIKKYGKEDWFEKAWEEYRQHILTSDMDDMKMPGYVFSKYIGKGGK